MQITVVDHPLAAVRLTALRAEATDNASFRAALKELTQMLVYEAMREAAVAPVTVTTPLEDTDGAALAAPPLLVPVLRAGLGMVDQAHAMLPESQVGFVGMGRNEETHVPEPYFQSLPADLAGRPVFVLDPMLATGGSMVETLSLLAQRGATDVTAVCVVAAPRACRRSPTAAIPSGWSRPPSTGAERERLHRARSRRRGRPPVRPRWT